MTCATCGKEGCHPNYHKPIAQIIEECGPEDSVHILRDVFVYAMGVRLTDKAQFIADHFAYGVAFEDEDGRRVDPTTVLLRGDGTYHMVPLTGPAVEQELLALKFPPMSSMTEDQSVGEAKRRAEENAPLFADLGADIAAHMEMAKDGMAEQLGIPREMLDEISSARVGLAAVDASPAAEPSPEVTFLRGLADLLETNEKNMVRHAEPGLLLRQLEQSGPHTGDGFAFLRSRYGDPPWWASADRWLKLDEARRREWLFYDRIMAILDSIAAKWGA